MTYLDPGDDRTRSTVDQGRVLRRALRRLVPLLGLLYFVNYLDRVSLSYAGPAGLNHDLGLSATTFGLAAGLFFVGYVIFEIPSNIALRRFGSRRWLARIAISWGLLQCLTMLVTNAQWLYVMRFLLGASEAGFAPGVAYYLTTWFPRGHRGRAMTQFFVWSTLATVVGPPLAAGLIALGDGIGVASWRFLMLATGIPAVALGVVTLFFLADRPRDARWLSAAEQAALETALDDDRRDAGTPTHSALGVFRTPWAWIVGLGLFSILYGNAALTFFLPTIVAGFRAAGSTPAWTSSILVSIPFAVAAVTMLWLGRSADRNGRAGWHVAVACVIGAVGAMVAALTGSSTLRLIALCLVAVGTISGTPLLFAILGRLYAGAGAATALALMTTLGGLGSFAGPTVTGVIADALGGAEGGMAVVAVLLVAAGVVSVLADRKAASAPGVARAADAPAVLPGLDGVDR